MKAKHILTAVAVIIGIVTMAAGVAVLIDRYLKKDDDCVDGYIECDCTPDEITD